MLPGPLWTAAPLRLARSPAWLALLGLAAALLAAASVSVPLLERLAADAGLRQEVAAAAERGVAGDAPAVRSSLLGVVPEEADAELRGLLAGLPGLTEPVVTGVSLAGSTDSRRPRPVVEADGQVVAAALHYRDGGVERLADAGDGNHLPEGVWLPEHVADELSVGVGDTVGVGLNFPDGEEESTRASAVVAGTYPTVPPSRLPAVGGPDDWATRRGDLPADPARPGQGLPLLVADRATFDRLTLAIGERPMWLADQVLAGDPTPEQARVTAAEINRLASDASTQGSDIERISRAVLPSPVRMSVASGIPDIVQHADATAALATRQVGQAAWAGVVLGLVAVAAAAVLLQRSRRIEGDLVAGLGVRTGGVAGLAGVEAVLPVAAGTAAGVAAAYVGMPALGPPGRYGGGVLGEVAGDAAVAAAVSVVLVAVCAGATALWRAHVGRIGAAQRVPWGPVLVVAAVVAVLALPAQASAPGSAGIVALALPALVAAAIAVVWLRVLDLLGAWWGGGRAGRTRPAGSLRRAVRLASRRVRTSGGEPRAVALAVAVGMAVLAYAIAVERGLDGGVDDKVATAVGARTVVATEEAWVLEPDLGGAAAPVTEPAGGGLPGTTTVWNAVVTLPPTFGNYRVLAIDSAGFEAVADWGATDAVGRGRALLPALREPGSSVPVLLVGDRGGGPESHGTASSVTGWDVPVSVVGHLDAFPGAQVADRPAVVADASVLFASILEYNPEVGPVDDDELPAGMPFSSTAVFETWLWSSGPASEVLDELAGVGVEPLEVRTRDGYAAEQTLVSARWVLDLVTALGAGAAALGGAVLLLFAVRRADRDRVAELLLTRMGTSRGELRLTRALEMGLVTLRAVSAAALAAAGLALVGPTIADPAPRLPPDVRPDFSWQILVVLLALAVVLAAVATVVARLRSHSMSVPEVLRGAE